MQPTEEQTYRSFLERRLDKQDETMDQILVQTKKTNGAVASLKMWRAYITGGVTVLVLVLLPILGFLAQQVISNSNRIAGLSAKVSNK